MPLLVQCKFVKEHIYLKWLKQTNIISLLILDFLVKDDYTQLENISTNYGTRLTGSNPLNSWLKSKLH